MVTCFRNFPPSNASILAYVMKPPNSEEVWSSASASALSKDEDILIRNLLLSHDPDGRDVDSELLLEIIENIFCCASTPELCFDGHNMKRIEAAEFEESLGLIMHKISCEMLHKHRDDGNIHKKTMVLLDLLGNYRWSAKVVVIVAALTFSYGEFSLAMQLHHHHNNPLAWSIVLLKQLPTDLSALKPQMKALNSLLKKMIDITKLIIIEFDDGLAMISHVQIQKETVETAKQQLYLAVYWVARTALRSSSHIKDLMSMRPQMQSVFDNIYGSFRSRHTSAAATWELSNMISRLSNISSCLKKQIDLCHRQIDEKINQKLVRLSEEPQINNQEILRTLFALEDNFPFKKNTSETKVGISEFKDKVIVLYISRLDFRSPEQLFLLLHQTDPKSNNSSCYDIIWIPITTTFTNPKAENYDFASNNNLPWYSVRRPQLMHRVAVNFMKQSWNYRDEPIMVVMDGKGAVTNFNAINMVKIWGSRAYPFSYGREEELWHHQNWSLMLLFDQLDPLLTESIQEGRNICIYGGNDLKWIKGLVAKMEEILSNGVQIEMVYVGKKNLSQEVLNILLGNIQTQKLTMTKMHFFWLRLESMRQSKIREASNIETDIILQQVSGLLDMDESDKGWGLLGDGISTDTAMLEGEALMACLDLFPNWAGNVAKWGLVSAMRMAVYPPLAAQPCLHKQVIPFDDSLVRKTFFCDRCLRPMKNFVVYE